MAKQLRDEDQRLWREAMRGVKPLRHVGQGAKGSAQTTGQQEARANIAPLDLVSRRRGDDAKTVAPTAGIDRRTLARIKRGEMPVDARLDLHGLTQEAAHRALVHFIAEAAGGGARLALVITGKGRGGEGVLRAAVPRWLAEPANRTHILAVTPAPSKHGGSGALCILLRRTRERRS